MRSVTRHAGLVVWLVVCLTPAGHGAPWRFAFVGDTHVTNRPEILPEIAAAVLRDDVQVLVVAGDLAEGGLGAPRAQLQHQLENWRATLSNVYAAGVGVYALRGNHEHDVTSNLVAWNSVFAGAYAMPANGPAAESNLTFSFTYNNALFIGLDQYVNIHRVNQDWLDQQLAGNEQPHVFAMGHEAAFKVFHADCLDDYPSERDLFWSSLAAAGARVYLCGHDHFFNVARLDDGDGSNSNDLYQCIVGTGGGWPMANYNYNGTNGLYTPVLLSHVVSNFGYVLVEISGTGVDDRHVALSWKARTYDAAATTYVYTAGAPFLDYVATNTCNVPEPLIGVVALVACTWRLTRRGPLQYHDA